MNFIHQPSNRKTKLDFISGNLYSKFLGTPDQLTLLRIPFLHMETTTPSQMSNLEHVRHGPKKTDFSKILPE